MKLILQAFDGCHQCVAVSHGTGLVSPVSAAGLPSSKKGDSNEFATGTPVRRNSSAESKGGKL